jgi:hypothetical protein
MGKRPDGTPGKRPPAPSARKRPAGDLQAHIAREFYTVLERLDTDPELLAIVRNRLGTLSSTSTAPPPGPGGLAASSPPPPMLRLRQRRSEFKTDAWKLIAVPAHEVA